MNNSPVTIMGNVTADPDFKEVGSGAKRATFSVAVSHRFQRNGEWTEETSFFNVVCWRYVAEDVGKLLEKGMRVIVVGRLNHRSYENTEGETRYVNEIIADRVALDVGGLESVQRRVRGGSGSAPQSQADEAAVW